MRNEQLDRAFGVMPDAFADRIDQTLRTLEEEKPMKRFTLRTALVTALLVALLGTMAYAVINRGLEWYYSNRFTAYQEHEPGKHDAILQNLQVVSVQDAAEDPLVRVEVREASWVPERRMLVISLAASAKEESQAEVHPEWNLDADGSYVGAENMSAYADDPEARAEHWLWTEKGFGPVKEAMSDPGKQLVLFEASQIYLGTMENGIEMMGDMSSMDSYVSEEGETITIIEAQLDWMRPEFDQEQLDWSEKEPGFAKMIHERITKAQKLRERVAQNNGVLQLTIPYTVTPYSEDDQQMFDGRYTKHVTFEINIE